MNQKKNRFKDFVLVVISIIVIAAISHFVITNPLGPSRLLYYIEAPLIQWETRCNPDSPNWMENTQHYATRNMGAPASQLAYIDPEGDVFLCETGWEDGIFGDIPLSSGARFRFASTTKTVTAIAVLDLINQGKLSLDAKIVDLLNVDRDLRDPRVGKITIEHLLSHRAGWDRERTQDAMFMMGVTPWCPYKPNELSKTSLLYNPGEKEAYSNIGYCLLGLAIEEVTGKPFREYVRKRFNFKKNTLAFIDGPYLSDEVKYDMRNENFYTENYFKSFDFYALSSSAGLSGNASDLALLVKSSLARGSLTILSGVMKKKCDPSIIQNCYGYGTYLYQPSLSAMPLHIHGGKLPGAASAIIVDPEGGVTVWLGAGAHPPGASSLQEFYDFVSNELVSHYTKSDPYR